MTPGYEILPFWAQIIIGLFAALVIGIAPLSRYLRAWFSDRAAEEASKAQRALFEDFTLTIREMRAEITELKKKNRELMQQNEELWRRVISLEENELTIIRLQDELSRRESAMENLLSDLKAKENLIDQLLNEKRELERRLDNLKNRVSALEEEMTKKCLACSFFKVMEGESRG